MQHNFLIEVLSGIVITVVGGVILFLARGYLGHLLALLLQLKHRSLRGVWDTRFWEGDEIRVEEVKLKQFLYLVWGTVLYERKDGTLRTYRVRGRIKGDVFIATYEISGEREALDLGSFTVKFSDNYGDQMKGCYSWLDDPTQLPVSGNYEWTRKRQPA